jgi:uncharacterized iron-regulated membrane protein
MFKFQTRSRSDGGVRAVRPYSIKAAFVLLHRWVGLAIAAFLFVAGLTGALISWDHELDQWLNPHLLRAPSRGELLSPYELASRVEAADPRAFVTYLPFHAKIGDSVSILVDARVDPATGELFELGYNQVFVDPVSGMILGRREWGAVGLDVEHLIPFLYKLHYSLCVPELWGVDKWGVWFMGVIALLWLLDCFVAFYITTPSPRRAPSGDGRAIWRRWKPAWQIKLTSTRYRICFDIHRASGLWCWALLFALALTAASLNLEKEVARPLVGLFATFTPTPHDQRQARPRNEPIMPRLSMMEIEARAREEAALRNWREPIGAIGYEQEYGIYSVQLFSPGGDHGAAGVGPAELYLDANDGCSLGDRRPWRGTAGDVFLQIQFPLHSGRIAGLPGRIAVSLMGALVAILSATGVVIWWKKCMACRKSREAGLAGRESRAPIAAPGE